MMQKRRCRIARWAVWGIMLWGMARWGVAGPTTYIHSLPPLATRKDAERVEADPMNAPVAPQPPALSDPMTDAEFAKRFADAKKEAGPPPSLADAPIRGLILEKVDPDGPAAKAGLEAGDLIVAIDGKPTVKPDELFAITKSATGPMKFDVITRNSSAHRQVTLGPGHMGISFQGSWSLEGQYLRTLPAGAAPMDLMRIAALRALTDPELAESALVRAQHAGGPGTSGGVFDAIAASALFADVQLESALAYATAAARELSPDARSQMDGIRFTCAVATFRYPLALSIAKHGYPVAGRVIDRINDMVDAYKLQPHTQAEPDPAYTAVQLFDQTSNAVNVAPETNTERQNSAGRVDSMVHRQVIPYSATDYGYDVLKCGPGGANVEFSGECIFQATSPGPDHFGRGLDIGVRNGDKPVIVLEIGADGYAGVSYDIDKPHNRLVNVGLLTNRARQFSLRMTVIGDRFEFTVDGRRLFYGPMPPGFDPKTRQLTLWVNALGVSGLIHDAHWETPDNPSPGL